MCSSQHCRFGALGRNWNRARCSDTPVTPAFWRLHQEDGVREQPGLHDETVYQETKRINNKITMGKMTLETIQGL